MKKRAIAFLLSVCLSFSICAGTAFAEEPASTAEQMGNQAEVSIDPIAADEEDASATPDDSEGLTPVPAPDFSESEDVEEPADEAPAEEEPEITVPDEEAPAEDVLPDENIEDTTEITDDMTEAEEFEEEESELGTYELDNGGSSLNNAIDKNLGTEYHASFSSQGTHWYKFSIPTQGKITATLKHSYSESRDPFAYISFYNADGKSVAGACSSAYNSMTTDFPSVGVDRGTYYLKIERNYNSNTSSFDFTINYSKDFYCETELNDTLDTANSISAGQTYNGRINGYNDHDYYKITAPANGYYSFSFSHDYYANTLGWVVCFYNSNMQLLYTQSFEQNKNNLTGLIIPVTTGVHYLRVTSIYVSSTPNKPYSFSLNFKADNTYEKEPNNTLDQATPVPLNTPFHGVLLTRNASYPNDWFKFTATTDTYYTIKFSHPYTTEYDWEMELDNPSYQKILGLTYSGDADNSSHTYRIHLTPGTYYLVIFNYKGINLPYTIEIDQSKVSYSPVTEFIGRLYKYCLNRDPDDSGLSYWASLLSRKEMTGAQVAQNFVFSPEFLQQNIENGEFVDRLYLAFFDRESDSSGYYYWTGRLSCGVSRRTVAANFINSAEFLNICNSYGIVRGSIGSSGTSATRSQIESYVKRCYTQILGRSGDSDGINYWTTLIQNGQSRPVDVAKSFVGSREFSLKQLNNTEFVKVMYRAFMGREYDTGGLNYWVNQMNRGMSKNEVLNNFANSKEFSLIMNSMGV